MNNESNNKKNGEWNKFTTGAAWGFVGVIIGAYIHYATTSPLIKQDQKFDEFFIEEIGKKPAKKDSIDFYVNHGLDSFIVYEGTDTASCPENATKLLDIPYFEKMRILEEAGK